MRSSILRAAVLGMSAATSGAFAYAPGATVVDAPIAVPSSDSDIVVRESVAEAPTRSGANAVVPPTESVINPSLGITLLISDVSDVFVGIFDNMGVPITSFSHTYTMDELWEMEQAADGRWRLDIEWNGRSSQGTPAPRGVYLWKIIVQARNGETIETVKKLGLR